MKYNNIKTGQMPAGSSINFRHSAAYFIAEVMNQVTGDPPQIFCIEWVLIMDLPNEKKKRSA